LIESDQQVVQPIYIQLFKPSQSYPTVLSANIAKYSIAFLGKGDCKVLAKEWDVCRLIEEDFLYFMV
jgi:hypothetical protein